MGAVKPRKAAAEQTERAPLARSTRIPSPHEFTYFGFDGLMPQVARAMQRIEIRGGEPGVEVIDDAVYTPAGHAGLLRRQRKALAEGREQARRAEAMPELDEEVVYLGWLFNHYGHFLMQSLARVWRLPAVNPSVRVIFHHASRSGWEPAAWALRMLEAFGVPRERMLTLDQPTRLRRLIVPEPLFEPRSVADDRTARVHEAMARPYQEVAERIAGDVTPSAQPVYLSRRLLASHQRIIVGEGELEELLRRNGFRIAHPQTMSFAEQVRLMNSHTDIVSNAGSAAQNVLFALHAPRLHLLTAGVDFSPDYFMHATVAAAPTTFVNCLGTGAREPFPGDRKRTPHLVDVPLLATYLDSRGLLRERPAVGPGDGDPALLAQFDEAWFAGRIRSQAASDEPLPEDIEREAQSLATASWPVSLSLARYYATRDTALTERFATRFAALAAAERDGERLGRFQADAEGLVAAVARRCDSETAGLVAATVAERFPAASQSDDA